MPIQGQHERTLQTQKDIPCFNWVLKPSGNHLNVIQTLLDLSNESVFRTQGKNCLLSLPGGFDIALKKGFGINHIDPDTAEGAGELVPGFGSLAVLFFATLKQRIGQAELQLSNDKKTSLSFCDESGTTIVIDEWSALENELNRMGIATGGIRAIAEQVGFIDKVYRLDEIEAGSSHSFF
jgi:hypothetical protein